MSTGTGSTTGSGSTTSTTQTTSETSDVKITAFNDLKGFSQTFEIAEGVVERFQKKLSEFTLKASAEKAVKVSTIEKSDPFSLNRKKRLIFCQSNITNDERLVVLESIAKLAGYKLESIKVQDGKFQDGSLAITPFTLTTQVEEALLCYSLLLLAEPYAIVNKSGIMPLLIESIQKSLSLLEKKKELKSVGDLAESKEESQKESSLSAAKKADRLSPSLDKSIYDRLTKLDIVQAQVQSDLLRYLICILQLGMIYIFENNLSDKYSGIYTHADTTTKTKIKGSLVKSLQIHKIWTFRLILSEKEYSVMNDCLKGFDLKIYKSNYDAFLKGDITKRAGLNKFSQKITGALGKDALKMIYDRFKETNNTKKTLKQQNRAVNYSVLKPAQITMNWEELFSIARLLQIFTIKDYELWRSCFVQVQTGYQSYIYKIDSDKLETSSSLFTYRQKRNWFKFLSVLPESDLTRPIAWKGIKTAPTKVESDIKIISKSAGGKIFKAIEKSEDFSIDNYNSETEQLLKDEKNLKKYFSDLYNKYYRLDGSRKTNLSKAIQHNSGLQQDLKEFEETLSPLKPGGKLTTGHLSIARWLKSSGFDL